MPLNSSVSMKLWKMSLIAVAMGSTYRLLPDVPGRLDPQPHHHQPHQRDRDEDLPAQTHDLVVAEAREGGTHPEEQRADDEDLDAQPDPAGDPVEDHAVDRRQPA